MNAITKPGEQNFGWMQTKSGSKTLKIVYNLQLIYQGVYIYGSMNSCLNVTNCMTSRGVRLDGCTSFLMSLDVPTNR